MHGHIAVLTAVGRYAAVPAASHPHGSIIGLAALAGAVGITLWAYGHMRRAQCWLIAFAAGSCAVGIAAWTDALAALTSTSKGLTVLVIVASVSGIAFYLEAVHDLDGRKIRRAKRAKRNLRKMSRGIEKPGKELVPASRGGAVDIPRRRSALDAKDHHHHLRSPAVSAIFGTSFATVIISLGVLVRWVFQSIGGVGGSVTGASAQISSGAAAAAATSPHGTSPGMDLFLAALALMVVTYIGHRVHKRRLSGGKAGDQRAMGLGR